MIYLNVLPNEILLRCRNLFLVNIRNINFVSVDDPQIVLNFYLYEPVALPMLGSTWTNGLSKPTGLADKDLSRVAFLVLLNVDGEGADSRGRELGGVATCLLKKNIN